MLTGVMTTANFSKRNQTDQSVFTMLGCTCLSLDIKSIRDLLLFYERVPGFQKNFNPVQAGGGEAHCAPPPTGFFYAVLKRFAVG